MRDFGITNAAPYASAPTVGAAGDTYWNTTEKVLYVSDGTAWNKADTWTASGTTLTPTDATKTVSIAPTTENNPLVFGRRTVKGRLVAHPGANDVYLTCNSPLSTASTWTQDDATKASWQVQLDADGDQILFVRAAPAAGTNVYFTFSGAGNLTIAGPNATKAAPGTAWVNPSDPRLKYDVGPYLVGLDAIEQLAPICFKYNGLAGTVDDGRVCHGFDTAAVGAVMPECVGTQSVKLHPDDETETNVATMDVSDILLALVNAVKELAARVAALETRAG